MDDLYLRKLVFTGDLGGEDDYLSELPVVRWLTRAKEFVFHAPVTFFVGENGTGKSTFLEALAVAWGFNAEGGSRNFSFSTRASHSALWKALKLWKGIRRPRDGFFLRAESFYNAASYLDEIDGGGGEILDAYGGKSLHEQSHGESYFSLVLNRFRGGGLYILDEPEAALSPARQMALLTKLHDLVKLRSQLIIATHSPILTAYPNAEIYVLNESGLTKTPYRQTEHYQLTKRFLDNPEKMLHYLLQEE